LKFLISSLFILLSFSWARAQQDVQAEALMQQIADFQKTMNNPNAAVCDLGSGQDCDFNTYCKVFSGNRKNAVLYENAQGQKMMNFNVLSTYDLFSPCLDDETANKMKALETDPLVFPELLQSQRSDYQEKYKTQLERASGIFRDVKAQIVDVLKQRRSSANSKEIDAMIARVQSVEMSALKSFSVQALAEAGCDLPNAFYEPADHTLTLCPQILSAPDASIYMTLAHEIGHSIDPCVVSQNLEKTKDTTKYPFTPFANVDPDFVDHKNQTSIVSGVIPDKNPFDSVIQCLQSPQSVEVHLPSLVELKANLRKQIQESGFSGDSEEDPTVTILKRQLRDIDSNYKKMGYCSISTDEDGKDSDHSYMQESFADWISSKVLAAKLSGMDSARSKSWAFESQLIGLQLSCPAFTADQKEAIVSHLSPGACKTTKIQNILMRDDNKDSADHPAWTKRVSKIFLAQPALQKALQCKPSANVKACN